MADMQNIRASGHRTFALHAHFDFATKYRHRAFNDTHLKQTEEIARAVCADFECEPTESNGENNHAHLLVSLPPKVALTKLVNPLKGVSSRRLRLGAPPGRRLGGSTQNCSGTTGGRRACVRLALRRIGGQGSAVDRLSAHRAAESAAMTCWGHLRPPTGHDQTTERPRCGFAYGRSAGTP